MDNIQVTNITINDVMVSLPEHFLMDPDTVEVSICSPLFNIRNILGVDPCGRFIEARFEWVEQFAWAVPNQESVTRIAQSRQIVEIGAGTGLWAKLITDAGATVYAYDSFSDNFNRTAAYFDVKNGGPENVKTHSDCSLLLCWPPYEDPMAYQSLEHFLRGTGQEVFYIGEDAGGCCGDRQFHQLLTDQCVCVEEITIPQWPGLHDTLTVWKRKN